MSDLQKRIERLKDRLRRLQVEASHLTPEGRLKALVLQATINAIGFHLGDPQPYEGMPLRPYGRALGYGNDPMLLFEEMRKNPDEYQRRHAEAFKKLLAKFGLKPGDQKGVREALVGGRIWQSLPPKFRDDWMT